MSVSLLQELLTEERPSAGVPTVAASTTVTSTTVTSDVPTRLDKALKDLETVADQLTATQCVDLLERAAAFGDLAVLQRIWKLLAPFAYPSWALALALRCAHEDCARWLLQQGVDLLGEVDASVRKHIEMLPHEEVFTRFALTHSSPTLFLNPMDPTLATEIFVAFNGKEQLLGALYVQPFDLRRTCDCVYRIACDGLFDNDVFDDIFRACLVRAWHSGRHKNERDDRTADICFDLAQKLLHIRAEKPSVAAEKPSVLGDIAAEKSDRTEKSDRSARITHIMSSMIVPRADERVMQFVCEHAPQIFLQQLHELAWLRDDVALIQRMLKFLSPSSNVDENNALLQLLACHGCVAAMHQLEPWMNTTMADASSPTPHTTPAFDEQAFVDAIQQASEAGYAEAATWLLRKKQELFAVPDPDDFLNDFLL